MKPIKTALIGAGLEAVNRHMSILQKSPLYELTGIVDCSADAIQHAKEKFQGKTAVASCLADVPWIDQIDAVVIAASLKAHYPLIREALERNIHVLTEKPFTETVEQGEELVRIANNSDALLGTMHNWLFAKATQKMQRDLDAGKYGQIHAISLHLLNNPRRPVPAWHHDLPCGQFYDESPHCLYLLRHFAPGPLVYQDSTILKGLSSRGNTPAQISADFTTDDPSGNSIPVHLYFNFDSSVCEWRLALYGEEGTGTIDMFRNIYTFTANDGSHGALSLIRSAGTFFMQHWLQHIGLGVRYATGNWNLGHDLVFQHFGKAVQGQETLKEITGDDALTVLKLQHQILQTTESKST